LSLSSKLTFVRISFFSCIAYRNQLRRCIKSFFF